MTVLPSYRNQSVDLLSKSIDWFLYEGNSGIQWVKNQKTYSFLVFSGGLKWGHFPKMG